MPKASRMEGGQRRYTDADVSRLMFIRRCREFGVSIEQVRTLVSLLQDQARSCLEARTLAQEHLEAVRGKLSQLRALERSIASFIKECDAQCAGGPGPSCVILEDLSNPVTCKVGKGKC